MIRSLNGVVLAVLAVVVIVLASMSMFVVDPTEQALVLRFGQPIRDLIGAPGLYFKWPFIDTVVYIDKRILALDNERQEVLVSDNQRLEVDAFVDGAVRCAQIPVVRRRLGERVKSTCTDIRRDRLNVAVAVVAHRYRGCRSCSRRSSHCRGTASSI